MEFEELIAKRSSIRHFSPLPVEKEKVDFIVKAILSAPSAGNLQSYKIAIVRNQKIKKAIWKSSLEQDSILEAPLVMVFFADVERSSMHYGERGRFYALQDATIACAYAQLACTSVELGSVWIGAFEDDEIRKIFSLNESFLPVALLPIGYPSEQPTPKKKRRREEIIFYDE